MAKISSRKARLEQGAREVGLYVATYSPGDGKTRYRFFKSRKPISYFAGPSTSALYTALGLSEAETWLEGYRRGK